MISSLFRIFPPSPSAWISFPNVGSDKLTFPCGGAYGSQQESFQMEVVYPVNESGMLDKSQGPYPLVSFLHGALAKGEYYRWVGETLASKGYIVLLPDRHRLLRISLDEGIQAITGSIESMLARNDMTNDKFQNSIDARKIGIGGHSLGSVMAIAAAGQTNLTFEIGAVVALSPGDLDSFPRIFHWVDRMNSIQVPWLGLRQGHHFLQNAKIDLFRLSRRLLSSATHLRAPIMIQAGSLDAICKPEGARRIYSYPSVTKLYLEIAGANHVQFMDTRIQLANALADLIDNKPAISRRQQLAISSQYMSAWFDYILKGDQNAVRILEGADRDIPAKLSQYDFVQ